MKRYSSALVVIMVLVGVVGYAIGNGFSQEDKKKKKKTEQSEVLVFQTNADGKGIGLEVEMRAGEHHNHPMMAIWLEDTAGRYIQTLFVNTSMATSIYGHGDKSAGVWQPGMVRRPAALPYWAHKRGVQAEDGLYIPDPQHPVPDAYTGATPPADFILQTRTDQSRTGKINLLFEINQSWDWNDYWNNAKFPEDYEYRTSAQPAVVYAVTLDLSETGNEYLLAPIGHSHYSGADGSLDPDLSTLTTALAIVSEIKVRIIPPK